MLAVKLGIREAFANAQLSLFVGRNIVLLQAPNENPNIVSKWIDKPLKVVASSRTEGLFMLFDPSITNDNSFDTMCPEMPIRFAVID